MTRPRLPWLPEEAPAFAEVIREVLAGESPPRGVRPAHRGLRFDPWELPPEQRSRGPRDPDWDETPETDV